MKIEIEIQTTNAAFDPNPGPELVRILNGLADRIRQAAEWNPCSSRAYLPETLRDCNGNTVATVTVSE